MMNVNGKDTTEFITVQKVAAHKQSLHHTYPFVLYNYDTYMPSTPSQLRRN